MPLLNSEIGLILACVITNSAGAGWFTLIDIKHYVPVVILSTQDNAKLFQQLISDFKWKINWTNHVNQVQKHIHEANI